MLVAALVFAALAALVHVYIFILVAAICAVSSQQSQSMHYGS